MCNLSFKFHDYNLENRSNCICFMLFCAFVLSDFLEILIIYSLLTSFSYSFLRAHITIFPWSILYMNSIIWLVGMFACMHAFQTGSILSAVAPHCCALWRLFV